MAKRDYYEILGLSKAATTNDIKLAFRRLASKYHPDKVTDEKQKKVVEELFKEAKEAYETLSDATKRSQYDKTSERRHKFEYTKDEYTKDEYSWYSKDGDYDSYFDKDDLSDLYYHYSKDRMAREYSEKQKHTLHSVTISLLDCYLGASVIASDGRKFHLPKGVRDGAKVYHDSRMYKVNVKPDAKFKRSLDDLMVDIDMSAIEAMIGVDAILEHLDGVKLQFSIPAGIQNGQIVRLSGKGLKNSETDTLGDMLIRISISVPKNITNEQKKILKTLDHRESINI